MPRAVIDTGQWCTVVAGARLGASAPVATTRTSNSFAPLQKDDAEATDTPGTSSGGVRVACVARAIAMPAHTRRVRIIDGKAVTSCLKAGAPRHVPPVRFRKEEAEVVAVESDEWNFVLQSIR